METPFIFSNASSVILKGTRFDERRARRGVVRPSGLPTDWTRRQSFHFVEGHVERGTRGGVARRFRSIWARVEGKVVLQADHHIFSSQHASRRGSICRTERGGYTVGILSIVKREAGGVSALASSVEPTVGRVDAFLEPSFDAAIASSRRSTRRDAGRSAASNAVGTLWTFLSVVKRKEDGVSALASSVEPTVGRVDASLEPSFDAAVASSRRSTRRDAGRSAAPNAVGALWVFYRS